MLSRPASAGGVLSTLPDSDGGGGERGERRAGADRVAYLGQLFAYFASARDLAWIDPRCGVRVCVKLEQDGYEFGPPAQGSPDSLLARRPHTRSNLEA